MASNREISSSILEFLLLQPTPASILHPIFLSLPISPPFTPRLLKSLLLHHHLLQINSTMFSSSSQTLTSLELLEQLDRVHFSQPPTKTLQLAYSAVAVDLTVRSLRGGDGLGDFFDAVNRIWNERVGDLESGEGKGLVSERLRKERRLMEAAVGDGHVRGLLRRRDTGSEAAEALGVYVKEAVKEMGPTALEMAAVEVVKRRRRGGGEHGVGSVEITIPVEQNESSSGGECLANSHLPVPKSIQEKNQLKPGGQKDHDMVEEPLPATARLSTLAGGEEVRMPAGQNEASSGVDCSTSVCSQLPLQKVIQEKNQPKPGDGRDHNMVEPLPEILQDAAGVFTVGTGDVSNHGRTEERQNLIDWDQVPLVDKGAEVICARDISSVMHKGVHDTLLQPSSVNQNQSEVGNAQGNQNVDGGNVTVSSLDKGKVALSREGKSPLAGKKRERVDDTVLQPPLVDQNPTDLENGEENQNAVSENAMVSSLNKGTIALSTEGKSTLIGKKRDGVHDSSLQPSPTDQNPTEMENEEENQNGVSGNARVSSLGNGKVDGTHTLTGKKRDSYALRKPSIMDRNPTARTHKWHDDSIESLSETSPHPSEKLRKPRPKRAGVSDAKVPWNREFAGRRKKKFWSTDEEDTLRKAVEKYGVGNWTSIKNSYPAIFMDRTPGDLKDKWRNMIK